jgi:light-regulated signal transduction histidine kinase (bacteriophytochrome)
MKKPLKDNDVVPDNIKALKHDMRNQLSNIQLAIEQLRFEIQDTANADCKFYMDTIASSCEKMTSLLKEDHSSKNQ